MKLKHISIYIISILLLSILATSCNDKDSDTYTIGGGSNDAQIYNFALAPATMQDKGDSTNYPILKKAVFAIDQINRVIYNPDSLPYQTRLAKFLPTIGFAPNTASKMEVIYGSDSTVAWTSSDSIDFRFNNIELKVTAPGTETKLYSLKLNVHQIDPDTIEWKKLPSVTALNTSIQKTLIKDGALYIYVSDATGVNGIKLYKSSTPDVNWSSAPSTVTPSTLKVESITNFGGKFYAIDNVGKSYMSADGVAWTLQANSNYVYSILGVLPEKVEADDNLLVVIKDASKYYFAKTKDMATIVVVDSIKYSQEKNVIPSDFLATGFTSVTNFNRTLSTQNMLMVSGGKTFDGDLVADTWLLSCDSKHILELGTSYNQGRVFKNKDDFKTFPYDKGLYAMTNDSVYISNWGYQWKRAPQKQSLAVGMATHKDMSVVVDDSNYIWVVTKKDLVYEVWRGRLNRLIK